jgi:hypothetical protein
MSRVPLPFGRRHLLFGLPVPPGSPAPLAIGLPSQRPGPRRGFHVPRTRDTTGVGAPYTPGPVVFPRPVDRPRPPLAASSSGQALVPWSSSRHPRLGLTRHHRGFTCVRPSGLPLARLLPRTERGPLSFFPGLRTLTSETCERTPGRGLISNTDQELRIRSITGLRSASSLEMRDFVSHRSTTTARPISHSDTACVHSPEHITRSTTADRQIPPRRHTIRRQQNHSKTHEPPTERRSIASRRGPTEPHPPGRWRRCRPK